MSASRVCRSRGFSLIELVIVVVIIGIIAAIAIPRMSRGAAGAADSALQANLQVLRNALDLFQTEHIGKYPTFAQMPNALLQFSDEPATTVQAAKDPAAGIIFGPYLRAIPPLPVGVEKGKTTFASGAAYTAGSGWLYDAATGQVRANCQAAEVDARNIPYINY